MGRVGSCIDNAAAEAFFLTLEQQGALRAALLRPGVPSGDVYAAVRRTLGEHGVDFPPTPPARAAGPRCPRCSRVPITAMGSGCSGRRRGSSRARRRQCLRDTAFNIEVVAGNDRIPRAKLEDELIITDAGAEPVMHLPYVVS